MICSGPRTEYDQGKIKLLTPSTFAGFVLGEALQYPVYARVLNNNSYPIVGLPVYAKVQIISYRDPDMSTLCNVISTSSNSLQVHLQLQSDFSKSNGLFCRFLFSRQKLSKTFASSKLSEPSNPPTMTESQLFLGFASCAVFRAQSKSNSTTLDAVETQTRAVAKPRYFGTSLLWSHFFQELFL